MWSVRPGGQLSSGLTINLVQSSSDQWVGQILPVWHWIGMITICCVHLISCIVCLMPSPVLCWWEPQPASDNCHQEIDTLQACAACTSWGSKHFRVTGQPISGLMTASSPVLSSLVAYCHFIPVHTGLRLNQKHLSRLRRPTNIHM